LLSPEPTSRVRSAVLWLAILSGLGTLGYVAIEGMSPLDALYMTVITISTVGYREVAPLGVAGQLFTIALIVAGVGSFLAGADQAISAYQIGGLRIAASILRPSVVDFLEISAGGRGEVDLEEIVVGESSAICGRTVDAIEKDSPRLRVVGLKRGDEAIRIIPEGGL